MKRQWPQLLANKYRNTKLINHKLSPCHLITLRFMPKIWTNERRLMEFERTNQNQVWENKERLQSSKLKESSVFTTCPTCREKKRTWKIEGRPGNLKARVTRVTYVESCSGVSTYSVPARGDPFTMSRLDRLFTLLSSSTSSSTSTLAAEQLGEIQKTCPEQIHVLLSKLHPLFRSSKWEVRIAASKALANVLKNVQVEPQQFVPKDETQVWSLDWIIIF